MDLSMSKSKRALSNDRTGTRVGNGSSLLHSVDGRTLEARRYREIFDGIREDLGGEISKTQEIFARRAAALAFWCEKSESEMIQSGTFDQTSFLTAINSLRRILSDLGLTHDSEPLELVRAKKVHTAVHNHLRKVESQ